MRYTVDKNECWVWTGNVGADGYGKIAIKTKTFRAHRIMAHLAIKPLKSEAEIVAHKCDNRLCINPAHLFITTVMGNVQDRCAKGRGAVGEKCQLSKLTKEQVIKIRSRHKNGDSVKTIAKDYPLTYGGILAVVRKWTWKHIP